MRVSDAWFPFCRWSLSPDSRYSVVSDVIVSGNDDCELEFSGEATFTRGKDWQLAAWGNYFADARRRTGTPALLSCTCVLQQTTSSRIASRTAIGSMRLRHTRKAIKFCLLFYFKKKICQSKQCHPATPPPTATCILPRHWLLMRCLHLRASFPAAANPSAYRKKGTRLLPTVPVSLAIVDEL